MVFPVVMYGCDNWTVKKAECRRIDAFELCWYQPCTYQGLPLGWYLGTWIGGEFPLLPTDQVTLLAQTVGTNHMAYAEYPLSFRSLEF